MTTALVLEHIAGEGAGSLRRWLSAAGLDLEFIRLHEGDALPAKVTQDALVVMGGPQSAHETDAGQGVEIALIADALAAHIPILGICLGAQLLALAAGGDVAPNAAGFEYGPGLVLRTDLAAEDPVFRTVPFLPDVVHWHNDEVRVLPPGAVLLCRGTHTQNQAFRVGENAWAMQFHIEVDEEMVGRWATEDGVDPASVVPFPEDVDLERTWGSAMDAFARIAKGGFGGTVL